MRSLHLGLVGLLALAGGGCYEPMPPPKELRSIPIVSLDGVITAPGEAVVLDSETTWDGNGSLRMHAEGTSQVILYELEDVDVEDAILTYQARLKTQDVEGQVYLEMLCTFPAKGTFFSRALDTAITGTTDWIVQETQFLLEKGENPSRIHLNVQIDGTGNVWVDDIHLFASQRP